MTVSSGGATVRTMSEPADELELFPAVVAGPVEAPDPATGEPTDERHLEPLTAREKEMLILEQSWWRYAGAKQQTIRDKWDISEVRYYQLLNRLIDKEAALAWDPITVNRLRRYRAQRQRSRSARRLGIDL